MSTSSRENRFIASIGKPRRSPPGDVQGSFFTGQGGRTVLPPLSSAFPTSRFPVPATYTTPYTQPRSSPGRYDLNSQAFYGPWTSGNASPQLYHNYETSLSNYTTTAYPSRTSSPVGVSPDSPEESRRLPPPTTTNVERWPGTYVQTGSNYQTGARSSPTYTPVYANYSVGSPSTQYSYPISPQEHTSQHQSQLANLQPSSHTSVYGEIDPQRSEPRPSSPYSRNAANTQQPSNVSVPPPSGQPAPTTPEEPTIKKKRKRADANQLKVLNETYARTAFPSTEERLALAKLLDMSPRSVQIWFQNKRQSMRQTNRQSSSTSSTTHHSFAVGSQVDSFVNDMGNASSAYDSGPVTMMDVSYLTAQDATSRAHNPHTSSTYQRIRGLEENETTRKWSRGC